MIEPGGTPVAAGRGHGTDGGLPALGEHAGALLRAVGMTDDEIAALRRDGVIA